MEAEDFRKDYLEILGKTLQIQGKQYLLLGLAVAMLAINSLLLIIIAFKVVYG